MLYVLRATAIKALTAGAFAYPIVPKITIVHTQGIAGSKAVQSHPTSLLVHIFYALIATVIQKTVTLKAEHHRFQKNHLQLGPLVRDRLDSHIEDGTLDELPKTGSRRRDIEAVRTSVLIKPRHKKALERYDVNLSQAIAEIIEAEIERERKLQQIEKRLEEDPL